MPLDYPKHVYQGGDISQASRIVRNEDEEIAASLEGYEAIARHFGPGIDGVKDATPLDYPRFLYLGGDIEAPDPVRVGNSDEEAAAGARGYARLGAEPENGKRKGRGR